MFGKILVVVFALAVTATAAAAQVVEDGLVSYWTFDKSSVTGNVVKDVWGNNNGTVMGGAQIVEGKIGNALKLDGKDDYVDCGKDASLNMGEGDFSIEYWVKYGVVSEKCYIFIKMKPEANYTGYHGSISETGNVSFDVQSHNASNTFRVDTVNTFDDNKWHHVVCRADRSETPADAGLNIYVDGVKQELSIRTGTGDIMASIDNEHNFYIGTLFNVSRGFFSGTVDEVRVYNKLLNENEILKNFASKGLAVSKPDSKLAIAWGQIKASG
jgi:hypothetical protein